MKKLLLFTASLLLLGGTTSSAQDWKEALKKAATAAADKATDGKLTQYALAVSTQMKRRLPERSVSRSRRLLVPMKEAILGRASAVRR